MLEVTELLVMDQGQAGGRPDGLRSRKPEALVGPTRSPVVACFFFGCVAGPLRAVAAPEKRVLRRSLIQPWTSSLSSDTFLFF